MSESYIKILTEILKKHFDEVVQDLVDRKPKNENPFTEVLSIVQKADLDRVYKTIAFAVHPDRGGSNESMTKLNEAYSKVKDNGREN